MRAFSISSFSFCAAPSFSFSAFQRAVKRGRLFFEIGKFAFEFPEPVARRTVGFLLKRFLLDLQLHDAAIEFVELFGLRIDLHAQARGRLVDEVDRLVGQETVGDVAVRKRRGGDDGGVGDAHAVMQFVLLLKSAQDRHGVLDRGLRDEHRLEAPRESRVLFHVLAVFVERRRADAMQFAARESGLQKVRRVHRAVRLAGADERVHFVDEEDDAAFGGRHLVRARP